MLTLIHRGGPFMWVLVALAVIILALTIKKIIDLFFKPNQTRWQLENGINAILFWGGISAIIGYLAHYTGMYLAMEEIAHAHDISPGIVAMGYGVALISVLTGLVILLASAIIWFLLRWRFKHLTARMD